MKSTEELEIMNKFLKNIKSKKEINTIKEFFIEEHNKEREKELLIKNTHELLAPIIKFLRNNKKEEPISGETTIINTIYYFIMNMADDNPKRAMYIAQQMIKNAEEGAAASNE